MIRFFYGANKTFTDVTSEVRANCLCGDRVYIPAGDTGAAFFPDPLPGIAKGIFVVRQDRGVFTGQMYGPDERIWLSLREDEYEPRLDRPIKKIKLPRPALNTGEIMAFFHSQLEFAGGELWQEWVEQTNCIDFLDPAAKVLELGAGFGRNTMMISCILNDESNFVTLECNASSVEVLRKNRTANNFRFHIEPAALSYRKLMYSPELALTVPGEELRHGYEWINTITVEEINAKYSIDFDTLVADCEGALYYILQDNPNLLDNIRTVILESDYLEAEHKWAVEAIFKRFGLQKVKSWRMEPPTADLPRECMDSFWEVWRR